LITPLPDSVDFESAAFTTLGAIALHGFRLAEAQLGERIAIIGMGLLGLLATGIARAAGCQVLGIDLDPGRVALAEQMGAVAVLRAEAVAAAQSFSRGQGVDAILICADTASSDPVELAGTIARDRARVVAVGAVGLNIPRKIYYEKEITFLNSRAYGPGRYDPRYEEGGHDYPIGFVRWTEGRNMQAIVDLMASGQLNVQPLITHRFEIEKAPQAYELITGKTKEPFLGVLLTYPGGDQPERLLPLPAQAESATTSISAGLASPASEVRLGVLGAGNFATAVLLPAIQKLATIKPVGIVSASGASAQYAAEKFGYLYASSEENALLEDERINTVAILTRHHLHARQVLAGLAAGKHVFCEKPLALNLAELQEIESALKENSQGSLLMVGYNRRFAPLARRLKDFIAERSEPLVAHYRVNAGFIPKTHWVHDLEQGGGRIIGESCHFIDFLTYLVGEPPVSVSSQGIPDSGLYQEDVAVMTFSFPDDSLGTVSYLANGDKAFSKERVEVFCGGRVAVLDDYRTLELVHKGNRQTLRSRLRQDKGHRAEWVAFADAIQHSGPAPIPYGHLFGVTRASFAAVEALRTGNTQFL
jgi:predicted dehydrogenase